MNQKGKKYALHRYTKLALYILGIFIVVILGVQIYFVRNAKEILKTIVEEKSKGKIKLELSDVSFSVFNNRMQIKDGDISSTDSVTVPTSYHVTFNKLTLKVASFWPLILQRDLKLDSIDISNPVIEVLQWRKDTVRQNRDNLSVTEEMGRIYNSMLDVLTDLGIRRIIVSNASLKLVNKISPNSNTVSINNINLNVLRNPPESTNKISAEDKVFLTSNDQTIGLPNGRHHLSFKGFKLQLFQKRIELDSCTITAVPKGKATSSYTIFFKKLLLVGVDFAAMSQLNLVRADTVLCENPVFNFKINPSDADKKSNPDPEKIIEDLTSDLDLKYIGVKNAGIRFDIIGERPRSIFNSNKDNFEMYGLKIQSDSSSPVSVKRFDMMVRDYHLYNVDSSAIFNFDSIHFINKKIVLNNFTVKTTPGRFKVKSIRDFKFPYFELTGLDWYKLIFDQTVVAKEALIIDPIIKYTKKTPAEQKKNTNFFSTLQNMDSLMTLEKLEIRNGQLMLNFGKSTALDLQQVNLKVSSNALLRATNQDGIRRAVDFFSLSKGVLKRKDLTGQLLNMKYLPGNRIYADQLVINSANNNVNATISGVFIDNMLIDDITESIYADGLEWKGATVALNTAAAKKTNEKPDDGNFNVRNIKGENTLLKLDNGTTTISSSVISLQVDSLMKINDEATRITGVHFLGNELIMENDNKKIHADVDEISVINMALEDEAKNITARGINWNNAYVDIQELEKRISDTTTGGSLTLSDVTGNNTRINMVYKKGTLTTIIDRIHADKIQKKETSNFVTNDLLFAGKDLRLKGKSLHAVIGDYLVQDNEISHFKNVQLIQSGDNNSISLQTPEINFTANVNSLLSNQFAFASASFTKPLLKIETGKQEKEIDTSLSKNLFLSVDNLNMVEPDITIVSSKNDSLSTLKFASSPGSFITATKFILDDDQLKTAMLKINGTSATLQKDNETPFGVTHGKVALSLSNIYHNKLPASQWGFTVDEMRLENLHPIKMSAGKSELQTGDVSIEKVHINSDNIKSLPLWFKNNSSANFESKNGQFSDEKSIYAWSTINYSNRLKQMQIDSFSYRPIFSRDSTIKLSPYELDFIALNSQQIIVHDFDLESFKLNKNLSATTVQLIKPNLNVFRDKLPPNEPEELKLLPTSSFKKIPDLLNIKEVIINDGTVTYTEKHAISRKEGKLVMTKINGNVSNIKNTSFLPGTLYR